MVYLLPTATGLCPYGLSYIDSPQGDMNGDGNLDSGGADTFHTPAGSVSPLNPMVMFAHTFAQVDYQGRICPPMQGALATNDALCRCAEAKNDLRCL